MDEWINNFLNLSGCWFYEYGKNPLFYDRLDLKSSTYCNMLFEEMLIFLYSNTSNLIKIKSLLNDVPYVPMRALRALRALK